MNFRLSLRFYYFRLLLHICTVFVIATSTRLEILKGRFNYASFDCAARVLAHNPGAKSTSAILQSQKDSYMLNLCDVSKFIVLELCQDIRIDTLVLANFEYFSSMVKDFSVSVSKRFPPPADAGWRRVGKFQAGNNRIEQIFGVEGMRTYARYVRFDFETHYGFEYYCLLSTIRVYGKTMMEDFEESSGKALPEYRPSSTIPVHKSTVHLTTITATQASEETLLENDEELFFERDDFMRLVKMQSQARCQITDNDIHNGSMDDESHASMQENVFKAIYDRLQSLEHNMTRTGQNINIELKRIQDDLYSVRDEVGFNDFSSTPIIKKQATTTMGEKSRSFRAKLINNIEKQNTQYIRELTKNVDIIIEEVKRTESFVFWIAIFAALQITALVCVVSVGFSLGWFRSDNEIINDGVRTVIGTHRRAQSALATLLSSPRKISTDEQMVPDSNSGANSPSRIDLISTASRPLLLDESEAEIIEAMYIPSPLSTPEVPESPVVNIEKIIE